MKRLTFKAGEKPEVQELHIRNAPRALVTRLRVLLAMTPTGTSYEAVVIGALTIGLASLEALARPLDGVRIDPRPADAKAIAKSLGLV
jgi:hypothetical protein